MAKSTKMGGHFLSAELPAEPQAGETVQELAVELIVPCPTNPRGEDLGDLEELAVSIRETGIHQPLIVRPPADEDGVHMIAFGHRRFAAAKIAGLGQVPAIVRPYSDQALLEAQIIENFARADINELSEARAFQRLVDEFSYSQRRIAERVGCTQAHVSRRLSLLKLEPEALTALAEGKVTIAEAVELTKLVVLPPRQRKNTVKKFLEDRYSRAYLVRNAVEAFNRKQKTKQLEAEVEAQGLRVVKSIDVWGSTQRYLGGTYHGLNLDAELHRGESCHAVSIESGGTHPACMDYRRHLPEGDSPIKVGEEVLQRFREKGQRDETAVQREVHQRALEQAHEDRTSFIQKALAGRVTAAEAVERLVASFLRTSAHEGYGKASLVCSYLGVDPVETLHGQDYKGGLQQWLAGLSGPAAAAGCARAAMGLAMAEGEMLLRGNYYHSRDVTPVVEHYQALVDRGYSITEQELAELRQMAPSIRLDENGGLVVPDEPANPEEGS
ncbi:MAG: ParB/RepB/Spo0J family partition protein [Actinomycetota bacterium]